MPAERALKVISGRWKAVILYYLFSGRRRLSELKRLLPSASQKVLIQQLREMEEHGVAHREIFPEVPSRVEYKATELGRSLAPYSSRSASGVADTQQSSMSSTVSNIANIRSARRLITKVRREPRSASRDSYPHRNARPAPA